MVPACIPSRPLPRAGADAAPGMLSDPVTCVARRLPVSGSTLITKRSGSPSFRVRLAAGLCSRGQPCSEVGVWHPCTSGALGKLVPQATPAGRTHPSISVECTNTSLEPSSGSIKPNPLTGLNQRHVPGASTRSTSSPGTRTGVSALAADIPATAARTGSQPAGELCIPSCQWKCPRTRQPARTPTRSRSPTRSVGELSGCPPSDTGSLHGGWQLFQVQVVCRAALCDAVCRLPLLAPALSPAA